MTLNWERQRLLRDKSDRGREETRGPRPLTPSLDGWPKHDNVRGHDYGTYSNAELIELYERDGATRAVISGSCGPYDQFVANGAYNFCTGLGSPRGYDGK